MDRLFLAFGFCFILPFYAYSQDSISKEKNEALSVTAGFHYGVFKDLNYSPLHYNSSGTVFSIGYKRQLENQDLLYANLNGSITGLKTDNSSNFDADYYLANIELGYLWKIKSINEQTNLFFGGGYHSFINALFYDGTESITFFTVHGLDIKAQLNFRISEKHHFSSSLAIPFLGQLVRPPHTGWDRFITDNQDRPVRIFLRGNWTSLNKFIGINWINKYSYALSDSWDLSASYWFRFYSTNQLKATRIQTNELSLGLNLKF